MPFTRVLKATFLPPAGLLWLALAGLLLAFAGHGWGLWLVAAGLVPLFLLSTPLVLGALVTLVDRHPPLDLEAPARSAAEAIVVLDGGRIAGASEYGGVTVNLLSLERLRYGAFLHRRLERPLLVTGPYASTMVEALEQSFRVPVRWRERHSRNTHENALGAARELAADGIDRVYLVTHFWHMPRAAAACRAAGLTVVAAPMGFFARRRGPGSLIPQAGALYLSHAVLHEHIGLAWYRLRYGYGPRG